MDQTLHQLVLGHVEFNHRSYAITTFIEHLFQGLSLRNRAGETIKDHTFAVTSERIIDRSENAYHQIVGNQLTIVDIPSSSLAEFGSLLDFTTKHVTRRNMVQTVLLNHLITLCALA